MLHHANTGKHDILRCGSVIDQGPGTLTCKIGRYGVSCAHVLPRNEVSRGTKISHHQVHIGGDSKSVLGRVTVQGKSFGVDAGCFAWVDPYGVHNQVPTEDNKLQGVQSEPYPLCSRPPSRLFKSGAVSGVTEVKLQTRMSFASIASRRPSRFSYPGDDRHSIAPPGSPPLYRVESPAAHPDDWPKAVLPRQIVCFLHHIGDFVGGDSGSLLYCDAENDGGPAIPVGICHLQLTGQGRMGFLVASPFVAILAALQEYLQN